MEPDSFRPGWLLDHVEHDGLVLDVRYAGPLDGAPVVLLHGFPQSSLSWSSVAEPLVAAGRLVVAPDQRGYSPGARPDDVEAYRIDRLVADALAVVDAAAGDDGAVDLVGHDWGACVAWRLAVDHPERVRSLTALSIPHLAAFGAALASDAEQQRLSRYIGVFRRPGGVAEEALLGDGARRLRAMYEDVVPPEDVDDYVALMVGGAMTPALSWYRAMDPSINDLGPVAVPTTFVWGENDLAVAASGAHATADHVAAEHRGAYRFVPLPDVGHWLPDEVPELVAAEILARG